MDDDAVRAASRLHVYLDTLTDRGSPEARLFRYLLNAQSPDGSWSGTPWTDVCTAHALDLFQKIGLRSDTVWDIKDPTGDVRGTGGVTSAVHYLTNSFVDRRRWGNDWFDHAQVLRVLASVSQTHPTISNKLDSCIDAAQAALKHALESDFASDNVFVEISDWNGAATLAAASMAFEELGERPLSEECISRLDDFQRSDGAYMHRAPGDSGADALLPWHTANSILALRGFATPLSSPKIQRALEWLRSNSSRREDGSWGVGGRLSHVDTTSYVGRAFHSANPPDADQLVSSIYQWLIAVQGNNDAIGPLEGSLHASLFLADIGKMTSDSVLVGIPAPKVVEIQSTLVTLSDLVKSLRNDVGKIAVSKDSLKHELDAGKLKEQFLQNRLDDEIRDRQNSVTFSNKRVFVIGVSIAILSIVVSILAPIFIK